MQESQLILVVDDDPGILHLVRLELADHGFRVVTAESGAKARLPTISKVVTPSKMAVKPISSRSLAMKRAKIMFRPPGP